MAGIVSAQNLRSQLSEPSKNARAIRGAVMPQRAERDLLINCFGGQCARRKIPWRRHVGPFAGASRPMLRSGIGRTANWQKTLTSRPAR
jgi:hypothetical protein